MEKKIYSIQSIDRAFAILETVAQCDDGIRLKDLAKDLKLNVSTAHRILSLLGEKGYVDQDPDSKKHYLGPKVLELQGFAMRKFRLEDTAFPAIRRLVERTGETAHLGVLSQHEVVYVGGMEGANSLVKRTPIGYRRPVYCTAMGKCLTAWLPHGAIDAVFAAIDFVKYTDNTIDNVLEFQQALHNVREQGFATDVQESNLNCCCVARPIRDRSGKVVAALSLSVSPYDFTAEYQDTLLSELDETVRYISGELGYVHGTTP